DDRGAAGALEHLGERLLGRVRKVDDRPAPDEPVDELAPEPGKAAGRRLADAVGERVAAVPRQREHPYAELPEDLDEPGAVAERLGSFHREHQAEPIAGLDPGEVAARLDQRDLAG